MFDHCSLQVRVGNCSEQPFGEDDSSRLCSLFDGERVDPLLGGHGDPLVVPGRPPGALRGTKLANTPKPQVCDAKRDRGDAESGAHADGQR